MISSSNFIVILIAMLYLFMSCPTNEHYKYLATKIKLVARYKIVQRPKNNTAMMMRKQITLTKIVSHHHGILFTYSFSKTHLLALWTRSISRFKRLGQFSRNCGNSVISCASCFENPFSRRFFVYTDFFFVDSLISA